MPIYISIYSFLVLLGASVRPKSARFWLTVVLIFLLLFMGTRYYVGCDFTGYLNRFNNPPSQLSISDFYSFREPGFTLLSNFVNARGLDYMWLNVFASAIILLGFARFLRAFRFPLMILALLFPIIILQLSMSGLRQAIAVSMLMASAPSFMRGARVSAGIWLMAGCMFHASLILFLPMALLPGRKVSVVRLGAAAALLAPAALYFASDRVEVYQDRYIDQIYGEMSSGGALIRYAMVLAPAVLFVIYRKTLRAVYQNEFELLKLFTIVTFAIAPLAILSTVALHRVNYYVMPFSIVIFVYVCSILAHQMRSQAVWIAPAVLYGGYMLFWLAQSKHADLCYLPYQNYLWR